MNDLVRNVLMGAAGSGASDGEFIDKLFSTNLWVGNGSSGRAITTGLDLSTDGGLVWIKERTGGEYHNLFDTARGWDKVIYSNMSSAQGDQSGGTRLRSFTTTGFTLGADTSVNANGDFVGFSFKKAPGFFDIVTYTGNGTARTIAHSLGCIPGAIWIKRLNTGDSWACYHRSTGNTHNTWLNSTNAAITSGDLWNSTDPTATHFSVKTDAQVNNNGSTYVAYIFAHDEQVFGYKGNNSVIKCGNYTGNGSSYGTDVNLGWEPQWLLIKRTSNAEDWMLFDHMRTSERQDMWLDEFRPNLSNQEYDGAGNDSLPYLNWTSTGFKLSSNSTTTNSSGNNYIYIAIRRPDGYVGELPTAGSQVFTPVADSSGEPMFKTPNHYVDLSLQKNSDYATQAKDWNVVNRLFSKEILHTDSSSVEDYNQYQRFDYQNGMSSYTGGSGIRFAWNWKRYAGFDVVCYDGNSTPGRTVQHNLGRDPEMIWIKCRNVVEDWVVGHIGLNGGTNPWEYSLRLNDTNAKIDYPYFNDTAPTSTLFTLNNNGQVNGGSSNDYIAMLFASVDGISKVGYYTGSGYDLTVTTGFQPRFVLIKRTDSAENWFVLDTVRGWASGNDQYLILNSTAQQASADFGNPVATGFLVKGTSSGTNTSGGKYIYYAHA